MDVKKVLLDLFDKIAVGISALLLLVYFGFAFLAESPAEKPKENVAKFTKDIQRLKQQAEANPPKPETLEVSKEVESALRGGPAPEAMPDWLFHKRPLITVRVKSEQANEPVHLPPTDLDLRPGLGKIAISWVENTKNLFVQIDGYKVYRAEGEPTNWKQIASLDGKARSHVDKDVKTKTRYFYYVESTASLDRNHVMFKKGKVAELQPSDVVQKSDVVGPAQTKRDTLIEVMSAQTKSTPEEIKRGDAMREASAYLKIWRYFDADGAWSGASPKQFKVGDKVATKEGFGSRQKDYTTDYVLENVVMKEIMRTIAGQERPVTVNVVVLKDEKTGEKLEVSLEAPDPDLVRIKANPKEGDGEDEDGADKGKGK